MAFKPKKLTDGTFIASTETTFVTAASNQRIKLTKLVVCSATGNSDTFDMWRVNGSTADRYKVFSDKLVDANETIDLVEARLFLEAGDSLIAQAANGNRLTLHIDGNIITVS